MAATVLKSGTAITFPVTPGEGGFPESAFSLSIAALDGDGAILWEDQTPIDWATALASGVTFPSAASTITAINEWRLFAILFKNDQAVVVNTLYYQVIVESHNLLRPLENSFGTFAELMLESRTVQGATSFACCSGSGSGGSVGPGGISTADEELVAALINAYHNIGYVNVDFCPPRRRGRWHDQTHMWDSEGVFPDEFYKVRSTSQLTPEMWDKLKPETKKKLIRAQVVEANFLMAGNTPEKQRLAGLLSHSAGESAHFYRTSKPLELPVCRATANALKGIITYVTRIGG